LEKKVISGESLKISRLKEKLSTAKISVRGKKKEIE